MPPKLSIKEKMKNNQSNNKCCEKCVNTRQCFNIKWDGDGCCPCHKPEQKEPTNNKTWEEEFNMKFPKIGHEHDENCEWKCHFRDDIKSFIRNLLLQQKEEIISKVQKMSKEIGNPPEHCSDCHADWFYNQALTDIIDLLK